MTNITHPPMTKQELIAWLEGRTGFTFAKTMTKMPHEYILRKKQPDEPLWETAVQALRDHGYDVRFGRTTYRYFSHAGWHYWTMGAPLNITILINRARDFSQYDAVANVYDGLFESAEDQAEDKALADMLAKCDLGTVLDVGCGTGHLLNLCQIHPENYTGIDPSEAMLARFRKNWPAHVAIQKSLEAFCYQPDRMFETVVSLYGSMSYVMPNHLPKVAQLTKRERFFLMFFAPGTVPKTNTLTGAPLFHFDHSEEELNRIFGREPIRLGYNLIYCNL